MRSSLARAERSIPFGSRGPAGISRPDRARNNAPHRVSGTGWGEECAGKGGFPLSAVLPGRIDLYHGRLGTRTSRRQALQSTGDRSSLALRFSPENKNRVTVATPGAANPGRDSLEARGTLRTSPQTVKAEASSNRTEVWLLRRQWGNPPNESRLSCGARKKDSF